MRSLKTLLFILSLTACSVVYSQPVPQWVARFNGLLDSSDVAKDIAVDNAGNTYVTGSSYKLLNLFVDIVTISYDPNGNQRWRVEYSQLLNDEGKAIVLDNTQQYVYVTGYTTNLLTLTDYVIIKYRVSDGQQMWARTYNYALLGDDQATGIAMDSQNNPVITGFSQSILLTTLLPYDYATIKYDQNGNQQWAARYNGTGNNHDRAYAIIVDSSDNIIVTGESIGSGSSYDYATVKYAPNGSQQWVSRFNGTGNNEDHAYAITIDGANNVIVTGSTRTGTSPATQNYTTVKYNPAGNQQWASSYNGPGNNEDRAYAIIVDGNDNVLVTGESMGSGTNFDYTTVKYNPAGNQQWASRYNGTGNNEDRAYAIIVDGNDNVYVTGSSRSSNFAGSEDYSTVKYTPAGTQLWNVNYDGTGNNEDRAYAIIVDTANNVYITGESRSGALLGSEDYLTIKYGADENLVQITSNNIPVKNGISQNYPNPFNPKTLINFDVASQQNVKITIYNVLGNAVAVVVNSRLNPGTYAVNWDASSFPSGVYFYRITAGDFTDTKKLILAK